MLIVYEHMDLLLVGMDTHWEFDSCVEPQVCRICVTYLLLYCATSR